MTSEFLPSIRDITSVFHEEIEHASGKLKDCFGDDSRLFMRSVLPTEYQVKPRDPVQGGVALMVAGPEILIHPYVFRKVCSNGAIMARVIQTQCIDRVEFGEPASVVADLKIQIGEAVRQCATPDVFLKSVKRARSSTEIRADQTMNMLSLLAGAVGRHVARYLPLVMREFRRGRDDSAFGLANSVTAVAREEPDPERRWRLEELGGSIMMSGSPLPDLSTVMSEPCMSV